MNIRSSNRWYGVTFLFALLTTINGLPEVWAATAKDAAAQGKRLPTVEVPLDVTDFGEGWKASFTLPKSLRIPATITYQLWVEEDWLHAARISEIGVVWRMAFVKLSEGMIPRVIQYTDAPSIEITYAEGKYFIQDNNVVLRALRPPYDQQRPTFTATDVLQTKVKPGGFCGSDERRFYVSAMKDDLPDDSPDNIWYYTMSGPSREEFNTFVRLNPHELRKPRYGFGNMTDNLRRAFHGDCWAFDDGELLFAQYLSPIASKPRLNAKKIKDQMGDGTPPEIDVAQWFNVEKPLSLEKLKGKVVLIDFWATYCGPCVKKLPEVQALHDKYAEKGLVVIGMHLPEISGACEKFVEGHDFTFPIALDSGKTAESYGVHAAPQYFLVNRKGKVVSGYEGSPPSEAMIEMLLKQ